MRRTIALLTIATLGIGGPAHADTTTTPSGTISVPNTILADDGCVDTPVLYAFDGMAVDYTWNLDLKSTASGDVYEFGNGGDSGPGSTGYWCPVDLPGRFSLTGALTVMDADYNTVAVEPVRITFTIKKRTTKATIRVPDTTPKAGKSFHIKGCVTAAGKREDYRDLSIQYRKPGGEWKRLGATQTDEVGCYDEEAYIVNPGTRYLRIKVPATNSRFGAYSKVIKMKAHR